MAFSSSLSPNPIPFLPPLSPYPFLQTKRISSNSFTTLALRTSPHNPKVIPPTPKKKQKQRPSFYDQVRDKWSLKIDLQRKKFPWEEKHQDEDEVSKEEEEKEEEQVYEEKGETPLLEKSVGFSLGNNVSSPPWLNRSNFEKTYFDSKDEILNGEEVSEVWSKKGVVGIDENIEKQRIGRPSLSISNFGKTRFDSKDEIVSEVWSKKGAVEIDENIEKQRIHRPNYEEKTGFGSQTKFEDGEFRNEMEEGVSDNEEFEEEEDERIESESLLGLIEEEKTDFIKEGIVGLLESSRKSSTIQLPWERSGLEAMDGGRSRRNKAEVADKTIPEAELRRLRNISLRMMERIKVRAGGVTQALVDRIHEKWKVEEVVKLKFEGPPGFNMKRTHETLESRTGGLVIWRSGSSVVLYRGMAYKLPCVQQYANLSQAKDSTTDVENVGMRNVTTPPPTSDARAAKSHKDSSQELMKMADLNNLLDELGPRFIDWYGPEPVPVDADMLPSVVPGYKPLFRVLPYKVRPNLGNKRMTTYRRLARLSPPHFVLGRNRELQGLAMAMVKLWKRNVIAKIAIKRGVLNTRNERMAEELKKLTGGTLLSRNKEYIVFYRGNDFLSPHVTEALLEREKSAEARHEEEERARDRASALFLLNVKTAKGQLVAGTLAETLAAKSRWGNDPSVEDMEKMKRDFVSAKHASFVRYLEKKIVRAQDKVNRAENALRRVQEFLTPSELPSDLETITDEERVVYRKMGLSMKAFLVVGRREVFDGTVENMHLHWKHRELVKIIVRGRNFPQVKHIAISLEAESGGVLVSVDKTTQGYAIVFYRGKNYQRPLTIRPKNLLTKRQALERSIELQRREALIHHISDIRKKVELLKSGLDQVEAAKEAGEEAPKMLNNTYFSDDDFEDEGEEAYLETYNDDEEVDETPNRRTHVRR